MKYYCLLTVILLNSIAFGQNHKKKVLFIGNSYTAVNNLPQLVADIAASIGDTVIFDSNAPGGQNFYGHTFDAATLTKINTGNWDYVVLQEQSQAPSLPTSQVINGVFPYAHKLDSIINAHSPCGETVFYMTWGRKNGDVYNCAAYPAWQYVCTYEGMDSLLNLRYRMMADSNDAIVSPVGAVWNYIRKNYPLIELYQSDESHPSVAGSYAAACSFYATLFRKDPALITFNSTLLPADAMHIRNAAKLIVYDSLMNWHIGEYDPHANFTYSVSGANQIAFTNNSLHATSYYWTFGDGDTSKAANPNHTYSSAGTYTVTLAATKCKITDTIMQIVNVSVNGILHHENQNSLWSIQPNPAASGLTINLLVPGNWNYKIFNPAGSEIQHGIINGSGKQIDISTLSNGLYILHMFSERKSIGRQKFIKVNN